VSGPTSSASVEIAVSGDTLLTLALSKGRIFDETLPLLRAAGIEVTEDPDKSRKLILPTNRPGLREIGRAHV
jgi:ATP phosphoribosyltransferase